MAKMASRKEREKRAEKLYSELSAKQKSKNFAGTVTRERRGKSASAKQLEDRKEQESLLHEVGEIRRKKK